MSTAGIAWCRACVRARSISTKAETCGGWRRRAAAGDEQAYRQGTQGAVQPHGLHLGARQGASEGQPGQHANPKPRGHHGDEAANAFRFKADGRQARACLQKRLEVSPVAATRCGRTQPLFSDILNADALALGQGMPGWHNQHGLVGAENLAGQ